VGGGEDRSSEGGAGGHSTVTPDGPVLGPCEWGAQWGASPERVGSIGRAPPSAVAAHGRAGRRRVEGFLGRRETAHT
jgi:hypothetical protein